MHLLILSGRSGSGKTISLNALEDLGFYCIDNLPVIMLVDLMKNLSPRHSKLAVSIDARNIPEDVNVLKTVIAQVNQPQVHCDIVYLDASNEKLLTRFSETRRKHPLTRDDVSLLEALNQEQLLLSPLSNMADLTIDTTSLSKHQLCSLIWERVSMEKEGRLQVLLQSFGFKHGVPADADIIFDVRCLPNPYWQPGLRAFTGKDKSVQDYLSAQPDVQHMCDDIGDYLRTWIPKFEADNRSYLTVGIGCTGGQHRSVFLTEKLLQSLEETCEFVQLRHRDLAKVI